MKRKLLLLLAGFAWFSSQGQLVNDGATIVIQPGATLFVESNFQNVSGNLTNNGTMEVMGDFTNDAGSDVTGSGLIKFTGSGVSTVMLAGEPLYNVAVQKTGAGNVTLGSPMTINNTLTMTSGNIVLDEFDLTLASTVVTPISGAGPSSYIHTNDPLNGQLIKSMSSAGMYTFPVGDDMFYSPVTATPTGASGSVSVAVVNAAPSNLGTNPNYLTRNWRVNTTGFTSNILSGTYNESDDVIGTKTLIKGATLTGMTWSFTGSTGTPASDLVGATAPAGDVVFSGLTVLGTVKIKAFLAGAYISGAGPDTMTTALKYKGILATQLTSPYTDKDVNGAFSSPSVGSIPSDTITDWVQIQLINPSNITDTIKKSAFITKFGNVFDLDGSSLPQILGAYEPSIVRLVHRNHLPVKTASNVSTQTVSPIDFTKNMNVFNASLANAPMKLLEAGSPGVWGLWNGNVSQSTGAFTSQIVLYNGSGSDRVSLLSAVGGTANANLPINNVYSSSDVNMDGIILYNGSGSDRVSILSTVGGTANANIPIISHE